MICRILCAVALLLPGCTPTAEPQPAEPQPTITNSIGMKLKLIPAGEFIMGSPESELGDKDVHNENESPQHRVRITKPFYLGVTEVTQGQWKEVMDSTPWSGRFSALIGINYVKEGTDFAASFIN